MKSNNIDAGNLLGELDMALSEYGCDLDLSKYPNISKLIEVLKAERDKT